MRTLFVTSRGDGSATARGSTAFEAGRIFGVALSFVVGVLRIGTERSPASWERLAGREHRRRSGSLLHPIDHPTQKVKLIEAGASAAVRHAGHEIELAPLQGGLEPPVRSRHVLVVLERVQRGEPRVAVAVVEDQLAAMCGESREVGVHRVHRRLDGEADVELTSSDLQEIDKALSKIEIQGDRYPAHLQKLVGR